MIHDLQPWTQSLKLINKLNGGLLLCVSAIAFDFDIRLADLQYQNTSFYVFLKQVILSFTYTFWEEMSSF